MRDIRNALQASGAIISNEVDIVVKMGPWIETALAKLEGDCPQKMLEPETHSLKLSEPKEAATMLLHVVKGEISASRSASRRRSRRRR